MPIPCCRFPIPCCRFPIPDSLLPTPYSLLPTPYSLNTFTAKHIKHDQTQAVYYI
ncbi:MULTISPECIES: hypothetical protein [unclassified Moorena]|uniref:hypothetical protein n=1 Tax=unclassified Moorena TaxID=2683338 RepID=UPI0014009555|nr:MULTISPECIES: hypothetical protein [unclassified Moorena]NEO17028.1 hypothetical protein [Moorena sp. SIO3E8]NEQ03604.1 hypothetical protein [Moorena sp. SIO3F7]